MSEMKHGTHTALRTCKPRCDDCKQFSRAYQKARRHEDDRVMTKVDERENARNPE